MGKFQRVFVIVLDSLGFGAMPDAEQYGDSNVDTIGHIAEGDCSFIYRICRNLAQQISDRSME